MNKFLQSLQSHLGLVPTIVSAVQAFQLIGHSQETTVQKIGQIIEVSAAVGEQIPIPMVASISSLVESIAQQVFAPQAAVVAPKPAAG